MFIPIGSIMIFLIVLLIFEAWGESDRLEEEVKRRIAETKELREKFDGK